MSDLDLLPAVTAAAAEAAALLPVLSEPARATTWPEFKAAFDTADQPLAALLRKRLQPLCPGAAWAEEFDDEQPGAGEVWVVDAVDGAVQYLQGLPYWCVSIALVRNGKPVLAVLHSAPLGRTYTAVLDGGAFLDGAPVSPSAKADLSLALTATSHPPFVRRQPQAVAAAGPALSRVLPEVGAVRNLGPTSWQIAEVASGRIDAFWQFGQDSGNLLGGALVAAEAGAVVTDTAGRPWQFGSDSFLAAAPALHQRLVELLGS